METLTLTAPDDWHVHLRDGAMLRHVAADTARQFRRAIVMPNLDPPVVTTEQALAYRERIIAALPPGADFEPLMTLYLTDDTDPSEIERAKASGQVHAVKLYPAGATTNSKRGLTSLKAANAALEAMQRVAMPLLVHGEVVDPSVDVFDREREFIERELMPLAARFAELPIVLEHITTEDAVEFVTSASGTVAATITAHHLLLNRNALFVGGIRPHHYCLPVLKRERHRQALVSAATGGNPKFFLGTDSAPHEMRLKEAACGCAGVYTAHSALELYAEAFEANGKLEQMEAFASWHGPDFYKLPRNTNQITLEKAPWTVPETLPGDEGTLVVPLRAGEAVAWRLKN